MNTQTTSPVAAAADLTERLLGLAHEGILPFLARVEIFDVIAGGWVAEAQGSSVAWLVGSAFDCLLMGDRVRVAWYGGTIWG